MRTENYPLDLTTRELSGDLVHDSGWSRSWVSVGDKARDGKGNGGAFSDQFYFYSALVNIFLHF